MYNLSGPSSYFPPKYVRETKLDARDDSLAQRYPRIKLKKSPQHSVHSKKLFSIDNPRNKKEQLFQFYSVIIPQQRRMATRRVSRSLINLWNNNGTRTA